MTLAVAVVSPVAACLWEWTGENRAAQEIVERARREAGIPVNRGSLYSPEELDPDKNGALVVKRRLGPYRQLAIQAIDKVSPADRRGVESTLGMHSELLREVEEVAARPHFAILPNGELYSGSTSIILRVAAGGKLLGLRAQVHALNGDSARALNDLETLGRLCNRLNRIPTTSTGRLREDLFAAWLDAAGYCASTLPSAAHRDLIRLMNTVERSNEQRVLLGEASKELESTRSVDLRRIAQFGVATAWLPWQANAILTRPAWSPSLAAAWQQTLAEYRAQPQQTERFGQALQRFDARHPNTVNMTAMIEGPALTVQWFQTVRRNDAKRAMLAAALTALDQRKIPNAPEGIAVIRQPEGWTMTQKNVATTSASLVWKGHELRFDDF